MTNECQSKYKVSPKPETSPYLALVSCHVFLITISNILVQYPFKLFGYHTTWGALTYPAIFILTDLTTRLFSAGMARQIIFRSMLPSVVMSYFIASLIEGNHTLSALFVLHSIPLRIALASFTAYAVGQLLDIVVFQRFRQSNTWWLAPAASTSFGNLIDTILFFTIAFYHSSNPYLSQHWPQIAAVDSVFKVTISLLAFVPLYGLMLTRYQIGNMGSDQEF